jgi:uncharacterized membrane protein YphA (DoxX/SURF4 family)
MRNKKILLEQSALVVMVLTIPRVLVGWHFIYEGISKLATPGWSCAQYLMQSKWLLAGLFHRMIANPATLEAANFLNVWGLILIGLGLFMGLFTRVASVSGILLLLMYYVANPPFLSSGMPVEGHYYLVNKNIIEAGILLVFVFLRKDYLWGLDRVLTIFARKRKELKFPRDENHEILEGNRTSRRELIKNLAVLPALGGVLWGMAKNIGWGSYEEKNVGKVDARSGASILAAKNIDLKELHGKVPTGKIKNIEISRIIPGGNLVSGFAHSRDLIYVSSFLKNYFTDEKVIETLWLYEACGINTTVMRTDKDSIRILKEYWRRGGKIQWLAQTYPKGPDLSNIQQAIDNGAIGAFVMGNIADKIVYENRLEDLAHPVEFIKNNGLIAGAAAHSVKVPQACINNGIEVDFLMKTFHHDHYWSAHPKDKREEFISMAPISSRHDAYHDNIWCISAEETAAFFKTCSIPWIAYKVLAAGAIEPEVGFNYAFEGGADFVCVGMFDFQVIENANIVHNLFESDIKRGRKWFS